MRRFVNIFVNGEDIRFLQNLDTAVKAGMSMRGDKPLKSVSLWSIRSNVSVEPFVAVSVAPGKEFRWTSSYRYYSIP